ncbi:MoaD/ThiS family protein [Methanoregula sp.]|jgi:sulfur carrier protein|uniref:MoaD/ThiS family protein n=1 Tax=Methanoregula sp. TaxID=2052170 RepID=UPI003C28B398
MKLILPDRTERVIAGRPVPLDQILLAEGINPHEVIVSRNGMLIPEDTVVGDDDEIRLIRIAHGG